MREDTLIAALAAGGIGSGRQVAAAFAGEGGGGATLLLLGFLVASLLKFAQGSSTVAMITASASGVLKHRSSPNRSVSRSVALNTPPLPLTSSSASSRATSP